MAFPAYPPVSEPHPLPGNHRDPSGPGCLLLYRPEYVPMDAGLRCGADDLRIDDSTERLSGERVAERF